MKRFRLQTLERLRHENLGVKGSELHAATLAREEAVASRERLAAELNHSAGPAAVGAATGAELELAGNYRMLLRGLIDASGEVIERRAAELALARDAWLSARGELHAVQALHDRHRAAVRANQARVEQRELDEHAENARFARTLDELDGVVP